MKARGNEEQKNIVSEDMAGLFLNTGLRFLTGVYVFLILCVMPLYFTDGYARIGRDKYAFFYQVTTKIGFLFAALFCIRLVRGFWCRRKETGKSDEVSVNPKKRASYEAFVRLSLTDKFALGYVAATLLSYFFSDYRKAGTYADAWYGTQGWYMGACTQLLFVGIYFVVSRFWREAKWQLALWVSVAFGVFLLGISNRFDWYPIPMRGAMPEFITTIGNINWYCSYLVLLLFLGLSVIWSSENVGKWKTTGMLLWLTVGFGAILTQGSLSGLFTLAVMMLVLYFCSVHNVQRAEVFAKCLICLGTAAAILYVLRLIGGTSYNYPDPVADLLIDTPLALLPLGVGLLAWYLIHKCGLQNKNCEKYLTRVGYAIYGVAGFVLVTYLVMATANTLHPGCLGALSESTLFTFDGAWGSNRGISWAVGWNCFLEQDLWGKIVGIGPDTMVEYVSQGLRSDLVTAMQAFFGNFKLTNAHNEWLTMLVNEGIFGLVMYVGLLISAMVRMIRTGMAREDCINVAKTGMTTVNGQKATSYVGACGMAVLAYIINSMFSFQQIVGTATLFVILGMGEACLRRK